VPPLSSHACQVLITEQVLSEWLAECPGDHVDQHSDSNSLPGARTAQLEAVSAAAALAAPPGTRRLRLFSLNDYLGLSTHPDVRRAASEAALSHGMGDGPHKPCPGPLDDEVLHRDPAMSPVPAFPCLLGAGQTEDELHAAAMALFAATAGAAHEHDHLYAGPRSSALVGGYTEQHRELEAALAELKGVQPALPLCDMGFGSTKG